MEGKTASSAEVISEIDDLLSQILIRVPAKPLIRFKSVSKRWHFLISDASFRQLHTRRHRSPRTSFLLRVSSSKFYLLNPSSSKNFSPFHFNFNFVQIRQSFNGLLLVRSGYRYRDYYVYNPTTGESRDLMLPHNDENFRCLFLAFDPLKSPHYTVICLRFVKPSLLYEIEIYDSETHEWKKHHEIVHCNLPPFIHEWVYIDADNCIYSLEYEDSPFCFDVEKLMFRMQFFEDVLVERRLNLLCIKESFGHIHRIAHDFAMNHVVVHEMTDMNDHWLLEYLFEFDITPFHPPRTPPKISILGVIRGERNEDSLVFYVPGKIVAYHSSNRHLEELLDLTSHTFYRDGWLGFGDGHSFHFVESLAMV